MLAMCAAGLGLASCSSSAPPYGGSGLPQLSAGCPQLKGTPPIPLVVSHPSGGTTPFVAVCVEGKGPYLFVLDTGASRSVVDSHLVGSLGLPAVGAAPAPVSVGCISTARQVLVRAWSLGGIALAPQDVLTATIPGFGLSGQPAGVLGGDVLGRFGALRIDYRTKQLTVLAPEAAPPTSATILKASTVAAPPPLLVRTTPRASVLLTVLRSPSAALATAAATFGSGATAYPLTVSTGSPVSAVTSSVAQAAKLPSAASRVDAPAVGCRGSLPTVTSGPWSIGTPLPTQALASIAPGTGIQRGLEGTVASDVLSGYGSIVLDYRTGVLWLGAG